MTTHLISWYNPLEREREYEQYDSLGAALDDLTKFTKEFPWNNYTLSEVISVREATEKWDGWGNAYGGAAPILTIDINPGDGYTAAPEITGSVSYESILPCRGYWGPDSAIQNFFELLGLPANKIDFLHGYAWRWSHIEHAAFLDGWKPATITELQDALQAANALTDPLWKLPARYLPQ